MLKRWVVVIFVFLAFRSIAHSQSISGPCVFVFYDEGNGGPWSKFGEIYSIQLRNLLGHFPEFRQLVIPIEYYQQGMVESCEASIYLGSHYESNIPQVFLEDVEKTEKSILWLGYSIWKMAPEAMANTFGIEYVNLEQLDLENLDANGDPSFYRYFHYKGETWRKNLSYTNPDTKEEPLGAFELTGLNVLPETEVLSWAEQSATGEQSPYITRRKNFFYVADIPLSYVHEADRYFIFADILFDFLGVEPRHQTNLGFVRIEDVHPLIPVQTLETIQQAFVDEGVPLNISFVPVYTSWDETSLREQRIPFTEQTDFLTWVRQAQEQGVHFILHGVTHALEEVLNPIGHSGIDYEFWNVVTDEAPSDGTASFVLDRLEYAYEFMESEGMHPMLWLTPHYLASPTEYRVFGKVFEWQVGRITYFIDRPNGLPTYWTQEMLDLLRFRPGNEDVVEAQRHYFQNYRNEYDDYKLGQLFPYEIYGDVYGQKIIPECLGNVTPKHLGGGVERTIDNILEDAKRNLVLRDTWASVFYHPFLLNSVANGGMGEFDQDDRGLRRLLRGLKELGYRFQTVEEFVENQKDVPRIEVELIK